MPEPVSAFVGLGSNLGDRLRALRAAVQDLAAHPAISIVGASPVYESAAHTLCGEDALTTEGPVPPYLNAVLHVETTLSPRRLLEQCLEVERRLGRTRPGARWAPRPIDLDVLAYGEMSIREEGLTVPHPRLGERRFVLQPFTDLSPNRMIAAPYDRPVALLLADCPDVSEVRRLDASLWGDAGVE